MEKQQHHISDEFLENEHPIDIAQAIDSFEDDEIERIAGELDNDELADIFEEADLDLQLRFVKILSANRILELFEYMSKDDIVDILGACKTHKQKQLLNLMKKSDQELISKLLNYPDDSAGGIMTTEYIALKQDFRVVDCINKIREIADENEVVDTLFILNRNKQLKGVLYLKDLILHDNDVIVGSIMNTNFISVNPEMDQEEVSLLVSKYDLKVVPVVSHKNQLLGVITVDDIIDVIVEEHQEDMSMLAGSNVEEECDTPIHQSISMRLPWLLVNLVTAFLAAMTVGMFSSTIAKVVALAAINPIIAGMGGNAGAQELSVIIRAITLNKIEFKKALPLIYRQFMVGLVNGLVVGLITGGIMAYIYHNIYILIIILLAMMFNLIIACVFGAIIPLTLKALKIDPALASSIFLTAATDVGGFFSFLGLASLFIDKLT